MPAAVVAIAHGTGDKASADSGGHEQSDGTFAPLTLAIATADPTGVRLLANLVGLFIPHRAGAASGFIELVSRLARSILLPFHA